MFLTEKDLRKVQEAIEAGAGLDAELAQQCGRLIKMGAGEDAVRRAFVILENRLRKAVERDLPHDRDHPAGVALANFAFAPAGPLTRRIGADAGVSDGLRELFSGAFKALRNPAAHGPVSLSTADAKATVGFVNLLLGVLERVPRQGPVVVLPNNVMNCLKNMQADLGQDATGKLLGFLEAAVQAGLNPKEKPVASIPFRVQGLMKYPNWSTAKSRPLPVFYLRSREHKGLGFPVRRFYSLVQGLDTSEFERKLKSLGFQAKGKDQDLFIDLVIHKDQVPYTELLEALKAITHEINKTLD